MLIIILIIWFFALSVVSVPKIFMINTDIISNLLQIDTFQFANYISTSTLFSLCGKIFTSFFLSNDKLSNYLSINSSFILVNFALFCSLLLTVVQNTTVHFLGRCAQGFFAGILIALIDSFLTQFDKKKSVYEILKYKYSIISLSTPITITLLTIYTKFQTKFLQWQYLILLIAIFNLLTCLMVIMTKEKNGKVIQDKAYENSTYNNIISVSSDITLVLSNILLGIIIGIFLLVLQFCYFNIYNFNNMRYGIFLNIVINNLPFLISFLFPIVLPKKKSIYLSLIFFVNLIIMFSFFQTTDVTMNNYIVILVTNLMYLIFNLASPFLHAIVYNRSISLKTASTVALFFRSLSTSIIYKIILRKMQTNNNLMSIVKPVLFFVFLMLFFIVALIKEKKDEKK